MKSIPTSPGSTAFNDLKTNEQTHKTYHKPVSYASWACSVQAEVPQYYQTGGSRRNLSLVDNLTPAVEIY